MQLLSTSLKLCNYYYCCYSSKGFEINLLVCLYAAFSFWVENLKSVQNGFFWVRA